MALNGPNRLAALLALLLLLGSDLSAQDPWARIPALPTACYSAEDTDAGAWATVSDQLAAERNRRRESNKKLTDQIFALEPAVLQQRMMAAVQKNPAQAQEIMAAVQQQGTQESLDEREATGREGNALEKRREMLLQAYNSELDAATAPLSARMKKHTVGKGQTAEDTRIVNESAAEINRKYETEHCPRMWRQDAPALMAEYKKFLVETQIPKAAASEASTKRMLELFGVPNREYQPTSEIDGVMAYLAFVGKLYGDRRAGPVVVR